MSVFTPRWADDHGALQLHVLEAPARVIWVHELEHLEAEYVLFVGLPLMVECVVRNTAGKCEGLYMYHMHPVPAMSNVRICYYIKPHEGRVAWMFTCKH